MRIEIPRNVERFGAVRFGGVQKVFELDSGSKNGGVSTSTDAIQQIPYADLTAIYRDMAIVVPISGERLKLVEGVLCGIPHPCLIIMVSNSLLSPVDRFSMEQDALRDFCMFVGKNALIAHQKDPLLGKAFQRAGYSSILGDDGVVRDGKAEGMIVGKMLARLAGKKYIGFVDADNYFPGSVEEYVREYAAGFAVGRSRYIMVRIAWQSKPKIVESKLFFRKWGRTSTKTNALLNRLISHYIGFETEVIKTGNAGEHALTMDLALNLEYSSGYSIEPYHIVNLLEKFGGLQDSPKSEAVKETIEVYQIESRNPHLHEAGDREHVDQMRYDAMQVVYHSPICPEPLKRELLTEMGAQKYLGSGATPPRPRYFPDLSSIDPDAFLRDIAPSPYAQLIRKGVGQESR
ncbi:MAG: mannosyl-3-phosphoglycerate synthase [Bacteroidota bacterium]